ncbi:MAG: hypothetical protein H0V01_10330, partial [Bacteroidetes bacterium]|nr:hypothetical protein [Bacteroidota bacterium]
MQGGLQALQELLYKEPESGQAVPDCSPTFNKPKWVNAPYKMYLFEACPSKVGIGTTNPIEKLHVKGITEHIICDGCTAPHEDKTTYIALEDQLVDQSGNFIAKNLWKMGVSAGTDNSYFLIRHDTDRPSLFITQDGRASLFSSTDPAASLEITQAAELNYDLLRLRKTGKGVVFSVKRSGRVGIGTPTPEEMLDVRGNGYFEGNVGVGTIPQTLLHLKGTSSINTILFMEPGEWNSTGDYAEIRFGDANHYIKGEFGRGTTIFDLDKIQLMGGNVGIGTDTPIAKLSVDGGSSGLTLFELRNSDGVRFRVQSNGHVLTRRVVVNQNWADFVYAPDYILRPLSELAKVIDEIGHHPEFPSQKEIEEGGLDLGDITYRQQIVLEEVTRYLIQQDKIITELKNEMRELKSENQELKTIFKISKRSRK